MPLTIDQKRERDRLRTQRWHKAHPEREQAYKRAYNAAHKEENRASRKAYALANPEIHHDIHRVAEARRRARKRGALSTLTVAQWQAIIAGYKNRCAYCGVKSENLTQDHVTPLSRGGHHTADNVVPACWPCNSHKHAGPPPLIPSLRLLL